MHSEIHAPVDLVSRAAEWVVSRHGWKHGGYINVILVDNKKVVELNTYYLQKSEPTDVLAFNLSEDENSRLEGEIYISLDRTVEQAKEYKATFEQELIRLVAHGVLHLLGYRDDSPEGKSAMNAHEEAAISAMEKFF